MPITDYLDTEAAEATTAAVPLWVTLRALWSRIRNRGSESVEGHQFIGFK